MSDAIAEKTNAAFQTAKLTSYWLELAGLPEAVEYSRLIHLDQELEEDPDVLRVGNARARRRGGAPRSEIILRKRRQITEDLPQLQDIPDIIFFMVGRPLCHIISFIQIVFYAAIQLYHDAAAVATADLQYMKKGISLKMT